MASALRNYCLIVAMWVRSTWAYRTSFVLLTIASGAAAMMDFVAIMIMFTQVDALGGFSVAEVALLYGMTSTALGLADLLVGNLDMVGERIRDGTLDALLVRPVPVFVQVTADRFALRRLGRMGQGLGVLVWSLTQLEGVEWTPAKVAWLPVAVLAGAAIYGAVWAAGGAFLFLAQDAREVMASFNFGGNTMLQYPPTIFARDLVRGVTFVVPLAFVNWIPAMWLLGRDDYPLGLPHWTAFLSPAVAAALCGLAALAWRHGMRGYRSTGS